MDKSIGKNISKNLSGKYSQKYLDSFKKFGVDVLKIPLKKVIYKKSRNDW